MPQETLDRLDREFAEYATVGSQIIVAAALGVPQLPPVHISLGEQGIIAGEWERIRRDLFDVFHLRTDAPVDLPPLTPRQLGEFIANQPINQAGEQVCLAGVGGTPTWLVHGADGEVNWYLKHLQGLPAPLIGLRAPGWYGAPTPPTVEDLAAGYLAQVRATQPSGPYRIAGYCSGAVVAVVMANLLERQGETVDRMFFVDPDLRHTPISRREAVMFRLHQLKRRPEPVARLLQRPASETTLAHALARLENPDPHRDPVQRQLYRGLAVVADLLGLSGGTLAPVTTTATAWFTDSHLTALAQDKDKVLAHLGTIFDDLDIRHESSHTEVFATAAFQDWFTRYAGAEGHTATG